MREITYIRRRSVSRASAVPFWALRPQAEANTLYLVDTKQSECLLQRLIKVSEAERTIIWARDALLQLLQHRPCKQQEMGCAFHSQNNNSKSSST